MQYTRGRLTGLVISCVGTDYGKDRSDGGRRGRRDKQLLVDFKETRGYWKLKQEALDRTVWRIGFGRGCEPYARHAAR